MPRALKSLLGIRFSKLVVVGYAGPAGHGHAWLCQCDCGNRTTVRGCNLAKQKPTKSCGCHRREEIGDRTRKHGEGNVFRTVTTEYRTWQSLKGRCLNPNNHSYLDYGGRGISVCDRWLSSYENFLADMGRKPGAGYSIDRIDNNGNYEPSNCRWASNSTQVRNSRKA